MLKRKNSEYLLIFCEILFCVAIIFCFTYIGMNEDLFHVLLTKIAPVGVYLFSLSLIFAAIFAYGTWTHQDLLTKLVSRLPPLTHRRTILFLLTISICLSLVPVFTLWSTASYQLNNIGGLLPMFDAGHYYQGAEEVLHTGVMDSVNQRRPLYTLFFSVRLLITNFNFPLSVLLQATVFGVSAFLASYAVSRTHGRATGFVMFAVLFGLTSIFLPESVTENLGVVFGCISFVLLWYGIFEKKYTVFLFGLFFLTMALMSRAGPMLILPIFMVVAGYLFKKDETYNWLIFSFAGLVVFIGILLNQILIWVFGDGTGTALSNFSMVLYGLAAGGKGWMQYQTDFPHLTGTETQMSAFLYDQSFKLILHNPLQFIFTLVNKLISTPIAFFQDTFQSLFYGAYNQYTGGNLSLALIILFYAAIIVGLYHFFNSRKKQPVFYFFLGAIVATWLSLPFIYADAPFRTLAAIFPIIAAIIAIGTLGWRSSPPQFSSDKNDSFDYVKFSAGIGIGILLVSMIIPVIGPGIAGFLMSDAQHTTYNYNTPLGEETFVMRIDPGVPYIQIVNESMIPHTFVPQIIRTDFTIPDWIKKYYNITGFPDDQTHPIFLRGYDELSNRTVLILAPNEFISHQRQIVTFRATCVNCPNMSFPGPLRIYKVT